MAPSSSDLHPGRERGAGKRPAVSFGTVLDRVALSGLVLGLILYMMPFWREGRLRWAFWVTFAAVLLNVWATHRRATKTLAGTVSAPAAAGGGLTPAPDPQRKGSPA